MATACGLGPRSRCNGKAVEELLSGRLKVEPEDFVVDEVSLAGEVASAAATAPRDATALLEALAAHEARLVKRSRVDETAPSGGAEPDAAPAADAETPKDGAEEARAPAGDGAAPAAAAEPAAPADEAPMEDGQVEEAPMEEVKEAPMEEVKEAPTEEVGEAPAAPEARTSPRRALEAAALEAAFPAEALAAAAAFEARALDALAGVAPVDAVGGAVVALAAVVDDEAKPALYRALARRFPATAFQISKDAPEASCAVDARFAALGGLLSRGDLVELAAWAKARDQTQPPVAVAAPRDRAARRALHTELGKQVKGADTRTIEGRIVVWWRAEKKERRKAKKAAKKRKREVVLDDDDDGGDDGDLVVRCVLRKRNVESLSLMKALTKQFRAPVGAVAAAGVKDKRALTWQFVTIKIGRSRNAIAALRWALTTETPAKIGADAALYPVDVVERMLQPGDLRGNRFAVVVRDVAGDAAPLVDAFRRNPVFLNAFGTQRVGKAGGGDVPPPTWEIGRALLSRRHGEAFLLACASCLGDFATNAPLAAVRAAVATGAFDRGAAKKLAAALPRNAPARDAAVAYARTASCEAAAAAPPHRARTLWLHAYQSYVFNVAAAARLDAGPLDAPLPGDDRDGGGELALPLVGSRTVLGAGAAADAAAAVLARDGVAEDDFKRERLRGGARRLAVRAEGLDAALDEDAKTLTASFQLPAGAYATTMLGELFGALDVVHENRGKHAADAPKKLCRAELRKQKKAKLLENGGKAESDGEDEDPRAEAMAEPEAAGDDAPAEAPEVAVSRDE